MAGEPWVDIKRGEVVILFKHEAALLFPVEVTGSDPTAAAMLQEQFGGANGELKALLQYLVQSFSAEDALSRELLLNVAVEEASHLEMVGHAILQLMTMGRVDARSGHRFDPAIAATGQGLKNAPDLVSKLLNLGGGGPLAVDSTGAPFTGDFINATGDPVADFASDFAAELRAGRVYHQLRQAVDDPGLNRVLEFLEEREATHGTMFAEAMERVKDGGIVAQQGRTLVAHRPPALAEPHAELVQAMTARLPEPPLAKPISPDQVRAELEESGAHLVPLA